MRIVNDARPWWGPQPGAPLSIVSLIENDTISVEAAAALWWALERGASAFVAAVPRLAGKTTLATALLAFVPEDAHGYVTAGPRDPLNLPPASTPTYLLINELSNHTPMYLAGPTALRAFALLRDGYRVIGTLHADSAAEAVEVMQYESGIPLSDIAHVTLVVVLRARRTASGVERRVAEIGLLLPHGEGVAVAGVAVRAPATGRLMLLPPPAGIAALAAWACVTVADAEAGVAARAAYLRELIASAVRTPADVTTAIRRFRTTDRTGETQEAGPGKYDLPAPAAPGAEPGAHEGSRHAPA